MFQRENRSLRHFYKGGISLGLGLPTSVLDLSAAATTLALAAPAPAAPAALDIFSDLGWRNKRKIKR